MRIHRLELLAWGPFPGEVVVDFDALAAEGLYLVHGATGAGKTSLLDAVSFALYASVPGPRGSSRRLGSDHADPAVPPSVLLDFTCSGRRLRVRRTPKFTRPKRSGRGDRELPATVTVDELVDGRWVNRSTRAGEADDLIADVVGLGREQFATVVVLPQGDFASFLRAAPEQRRSLLERLFDVQRFVDVEHWLAEQRRACKDAVIELDAAVHHELQRISDAVAGAPGLEHLAVPTVIPAPAADVVPVVEQLAGVAALAAVEAATDADRAEAMRLHSDAAWTQAVTLVQQHDQWNAAAAESARLDDERPAAEALERAVDRAQRARLCLDAVAEAEAAELAAAQAAERLTRNRSGLGRDAALTGEEIAALLRGCEAGRAALDSGARSLTALRAAERTLAAETTARDEARGRAAATVEALADVAARRVAEVERVEQAAALAARAEALTHELADLVRRSGLTAELTSAEESLAAARPRVAEQLERTNDAHTRFNVLRARQLAAMAATLSTALVDGRPCPVCGSDAHPAPADPAERIDQGEVDAAEAHWAILRAELDSTREGVAALEQRCASLSLALGTRLTPAELDDAVTVARQALAVATEARTALPQLSLAVSGSDEALAALTAELAGLRELGERHDALAESARIEAAAAEQALADALAAHGQCPCAVTDAAATGAAATGAAATDAAATGTTDHAPAPALALLLARAVEQHTDVVACLDSLAVAQDLSDRTREAFELARARLRTRLDDQGFDTADEVAAAAMTAADLAAAAEQLAHRRARQLAVAAILEDPALGAVAAQVRPDVDALSAEREQAHRLAQEAALARTALERAAQAVQSRRASLATLAVRLSSALDELRVVTGLADACTGVGTENTRRMPLSAYVLAGRLERVVELANERLARMGDGRYLLEHSDDLAARGAKSGLGLRVVDRWTGSTRDPASLSGGETFMASLALALGLADAVRAESGGVDLQTLFVDEGFGSLDDDSLDQVMDVLDGLRDGGRSVGIVSHVPELRQRIPAQVVVTKSETGSSVRLRGVQGAAEVA